YGDTLVTLPLGEAFHSRRLLLVSSQVGTVATARRSRWDHRRRLAKALELLDDSCLDRLIDGTSAFHELPEVLPRLVAGRGLCHRIVYPH
ncbi:MAG: hypothetical protein R3202_07325, partial [Candidatus Competibacterales bacterium]|nr:hypothetical protein [Candidatus Competibacterales bacterium]